MNSIHSENVEIWLADDEKRDYIILCVYIFFLSYISYGSVIHFKLKFYLVKFIRYKYHRKCTFIHHDNDSRQRQLWTFAQLVSSENCIFAI